MKLVKVVPSDAAGDIFAGSDAGGERAAIAYTILASGSQPFRWARTMSAPAPSASGPLEVRDHLAEAHPLQGDQVVEPQLLVTSGFAVASIGETMPFRLTRLLGETRCSPESTLLFCVSSMLVSSMLAGIGCRSSHPTGMRFDGGAGGHGGAYGDASARDGSSFEDHDGNDGKDGAPWHMDSKDVRGLAKDGGDIEDRPREDGGADARDAESGGMGGTSMDVAGRSGAGGSNGLGGTGGTGTAERDGGGSPGGTGGFDGGGGSQRADSGIGIDTSTADGYGGWPDAGSGGADGGNAGIIMEPFAKAFCTAARSCCTLKGYPMAPLVDCESMLESRVAALAFVDKGTVLIDDGALAACTAAYQEAASTCSYNDVAVACRGVFVGTKNEGEACGSGRQPGVIECRHNGARTETCVWTQISADPSVKGVCQETPHARIGEPCLSSCAVDEDCDADLVASPQAATAVCFESDGLYCASKDGRASCAPTASVGEACTQDWNACGSAGYCDWESSTCKSSGRLGADCSSTACLSELMCGSDYLCRNVPLADGAVCAGEPPAP
jgi:hypothetical protein